MKKQIQTFIIDDSALVRQSLKSIIDSDPRLQVMGTAQNPIIALQKIQHQKPDVILLDLEMPVMDGITFLKEEMPLLSIPVVIMSKFTVKGSNKALQALERASKFIRSEIGNRTELRYVPEIQFFYDTTIDTAEHIDMLLDKIKKEDSV